MGYVIGLTGAIASGKSSVSEILAESGLNIVDADKIARACTKKGGGAYEAVRDHFGESFLLENGELDRKKLGRYVFGCPSELQKLNELTHPAIIREIKTALCRGEGMAVLDAPLLLEAGLASLCDEVWIVTADPALRLSRLMERDALSKEEAEARMAAQGEKTSPLKETVFIDNSFGREELQKQVLQHLNKARERCLKKQKT